MATGEAAQIIDALMAHCATLSVGSPALPIAYPEVAFTAPSDGKYLEVTFFANRPAWEGLSSGKLAQGLLQITVVWPRGGGLVAPAQDAQEIINHFAKGTELFDGETKVSINQEPWAASPIADGMMIRVPVTIPWVAVAV